MVYALIILGALQGIALPAVNAMMSHRIAPERQGELQGAVASLQGIASIVGPLLMTQIFAAFTGPAAAGRVRRRAPIAMAALLFAVATAIMMIRARPGAAVAGLKPGGRIHLPDSHNVYYGTCARPAALASLDDDRHAVIGDRDVGRQARAERVVVEVGVQIGEDRLRRRHAGDPAEGVANREVARMRRVAQRVDDPEVQARRDTARCPVGST